MVNNPPLVFDGHNDVLTRLYQEGGVSQADTFLGDRPGHLDRPKAKIGGFGGGFFAVYVPSVGNGQQRLEMMQQAHYDVPLPEPIDFDTATPVVMQQIAILLRLEEIAALKICTTVADIQQCFDKGVIAAILHIEGCEAIDEDLHSLEVLYRAGLRSLGPVWSRHTLFAEGVPFKFPSSPDTGNGLTEKGVALIERCNHKRILVDLSHINEAGFWDVAKHSTHPLVATHSNVHQICPHARNLTDQQLIAIAQSNGMVGLNFAAAFLREDGRKLPDVDLSIMLRHLDHLIELLGENSVGFGSDFDGTVVPDAIGDVTGLNVLRDAMLDHGYGSDLVEKICHQNWFRVLDEIWGDNK